ncbi:multiprotein-bridging factor 1 family protein [Spongiactinospora sp. 9N601]|uniref:multiprotein-bridging factor 1 family protein n=1 Tax=Spongiactinospora sp. 9N601 TaxID=3375149 RepID=UPI0037A1D113
MSADSAPNEFGARLRELREAPPYWSRSDLARRIRETAHPDDEIPHVASLVASIKQWESGQHVPGRKYRPLLARALGSSEAGLWNNDAAAASPLLPSLPPENVAGGDYVAALRESCQALVTLDNTVGGTALVPVAVRLVSRAHAYLASGRHLPQVEHDLEAAVGEAGEIAAWLAYDADQQELSRRLINEALTVSRLAGDRAGELLGLSHLAMQSIYLRRSREALKIADRVLGGQRLSGRTTALFRIRQARALAQLGDLPAARDALRHAEALIYAGTDAKDPAWTWWIDPHELMWHRAMCHADTGQWEHAVEAAATTVETCRPGGARCAFNDHAHFLAALVHAHAWQEAEPVVAKLIDQASEVGSARTENLLRHLTDRITVTKGPSSTLTDSAEHLRQTLSATA